MKTTIPGWLHHPYLLNEEELANPTISFFSFLNNRNLPEHRETLWCILKAILATAKDEYSTAEELAEWVIYFRELEAFIESSFELGRQEILKKPPYPLRIS